MFMTNFLQAASSLHIGIIAIAASVAAFAAAFGISKIGAAAMEGIARQPEAANDIRMSMIIASALIEGAALFAIVVCFLAL
ncbi:MAG: ATP synthase F0 subunit C [Bacteroidales bacterium]|nr:ATP synthase F0 subunit C [Bacteroidales bacterium]MCL2132741.1 ATP synthase F0 subunit C [Bacteroidales bacterium]